MSVLEVTFSHLYFPFCVKCVGYRHLMLALKLDSVTIREKNTF